MQGRRRKTETASLAEPVLCAAKCSGLHFGEVLWYYESIEKGELITMSVSIHMNGRTRSQMNKPLHTHQVRLNKEDGVRALKDTDSAINPELTHMNVALMEDGAMERFKSMKAKLETISDKRVANGQKRLYKSANVFMVGTLQIGDDSLEALGWTFDEDGKKKPANEQSETTIKNVTVVYSSMLESVRKQPEIYGEVFSATLHFDETSPHVDFMVDILDVNQPDKLVRDYLNGPKGTPKGEKLRNMQDNLMRYSRLPKDQIEKFGLKRGDGTRSKVDRVAKIRQEERKLEERKGKVEKLVQINAVQFKSNKAQSETLVEREEQLNAREARLNAGEEQIKKNNEIIMNNDKIVSKRLKSVQEREKNVGIREKAVIAFDKVKTNFNLLVERFKKEQDERKQERLLEVVEEHTPLDEKNLQDFQEALLDLEPDVPEELKLTEEDLKALEELNDLSL